MDPELISASLEARSTAEHARKRRQHVQTLRGIRGVPDGDIARITATLWSKDPPSLPDDDADLEALFGTALEDGLVAIGLVAAAAPDAPAEALDLGLDWLERVDDSVTADALGWLVLGPAALASGATGALLGRVRGHGRPEARRAGVMAAMAMTPAPLEGPSAAALRARLGQKDVAFVEAPLDAELTRWAEAFLRDEHPAVRKALRRVLRTWGAASPAALLAWGEGVRGGMPKMLRAEVDRARRRA